MRAGMAAPSIVHEALASPGRPLDPATRAFFEPKFGRDFSAVRVHVNQKADQSAKTLNALAYTTGSQIVFQTGLYQPRNATGKKLLAHELTHVAQQQGSLSGRALQIDRSDSSHEQEAERVASSILKGKSPYRVGHATETIQRQAMTCSTKPVEDECVGATAKCQSAASDCKAKFPNAGDLDAYVTQLKSNFKSSEFGPNAKRNFAHWLDGSGSELEMPSAIFEAHQGTNNALATHRDKFIEGVGKRLADGRMKPGTVSDVIPYTGHANAFTFDRSDDLSYAVGGFQLCSNTRAKATPAGDGTFNVDFVEWKCRAFDCYNWDPSKGIGIQGLDDTTLCCVENAGKAKHFLDHSTAWDNKDPDSTKGFSLPGSGSGKTSPSSTPSKKETAR